jgi:hypothetical protein
MAIRGTLYFCKGARAKSSMDRFGGELGGTYGPDSTAALG